MTKVWGDESFFNIEKIQKSKFLPGIENAVIDVCFISRVTVRRISPDHQKSGFIQPDNAMEINRSGQFEFRTFPPTFSVEGLDEVERDGAETSGDEKKILLAAGFGFGPENYRIGIEAANFGTWRIRVRVKTSKNKMSKFENNFLPRILMKNVEST